MYKSISFVCDLIFIFHLFISISILLVIHLISHINSMVELSTILCVWVVWSLFWIYEINLPPGRTSKETLYFHHLFHAVISTGFGKMVDEMVDEMVDDGWWDHKSHIFYNIGFIHYLNKINVISLSSYLNEMVVVWAIICTLVRDGRLWDR